MTRLPPIAAAALAAATLTGCGITDPYATPPTTTATTPGPAAVPASPAPAAAAPVTRTPEQALRHFTAMFINWRFAQLPQVKHALAAQATGPLADQLNVEADQALTEVSRRQSNQANEGTVQVIADPKHNGHYVIVTRETARLGDARAQAGYFVYLATLRHTGDGWRPTTFTAVN
jgi:predicted transcriptional regulator